MQKSWKDIKIGDLMADGSVVTQIHRTHSEPCCKLTYDTDKEFICAYRHVLLIDVHNLPTEAKQELEQFCTFVPLEESIIINTNIDLLPEEKLLVDKFCHNEQIDINVDPITEGDTYSVYLFHFSSEPKQVSIETVVTKSEPQKVDDSTYWLSCNGIEYLMNRYNADLYCNGNLINKIEPVGILPCFCISTNTGQYET